MVTVVSNTEVESKIFGNMNCIEPLDTNVKRRYISFGESKPKEIQVHFNLIDTKYLLFWLLTQVYSMF